MSNPEQNTCACLAGARSGLNTHRPAAWPQSFSPRILWKSYRFRKSLKQLNNKIAVTHQVAGDFRGSLLGNLLLLRNMVWHECFSTRYQETHNIAHVFLLLQLPDRTTAAAMTKQIGCCKSQTNNAGSRAVLHFLQHSAREHQVFLSMLWFRLLAQAVDTGTWLRNTCREKHGNPVDMTVLRHGAKFGGKAYAMRCMPTRHRALPSKVCITRKTHIAFVDSLVRQHGLSEPVTCVALNQCAMLSP